jgi:hypothetical protein
MKTGACDSSEQDPTSCSAARRFADAALLRTLERVTQSNDEAMRPAVRAFVDVLMREGATPEAAVIALKETLAKAHVLYRFEPLVREQMRSMWVTECIDHYFATRPADDLPARAAETARQQREQSRPGQTGESPSQ